ncbi:hypothetical protein NEF87_003123 [Candidatus Lokiarchaeum ossiferum]|uniref:Uncharacterized protein n=1 Tax=Candidatus Lokiarchaeum ossiferum TaxID=2951803 RepID=A0ABY6HTJ7_9ARCH|nr:hypothetical protein NEF87_003123 [Candidatus Lokiarchaeum sp. B-35]
MVKNHTLSTRKHLLITLALFFLTFPFVTGLKEQNIPVWSHYIEPNYLQHGIKIMNENQHPTYSYLKESHQLDFSLDKNFSLACSDGLYEYKEFYNTSNWDDVDSFSPYQISQNRDIEYSMAYNISDTARNSFTISFEDMFLIYPSESVIIDNSGSDPVINNLLGYSKSPYSEATFSSTNISSEKISSSTIRNGWSSNYAGCLIEGSSYNGSDNKINVAIQNTFDISSQNSSLYFSLFLSNLDQLELLFNNSILPDKTQYGLGVKIHLHTTNLGDSSYFPKFISESSYRSQGMWNLFPLDEGYGVEMFHFTDYQDPNLETFYFVFPRLKIGQYNKLFYNFELKLNHDSIKVGGFSLDDLASIPSYSPLLVLVLFCTITGLIYVVNTKKIQS